ncbi:F-box domain [Trinorchestia longiramus]|nr:F-box domain [Trinorchestia longiramus]
MEMNPVVEESDEETHVCTISDLPNEILTHIFSFLNPIILWSNIIPVCECWKKVASHPSLWHSLTFQYENYPNYESVLEIISQCPALASLKMQSLLNATPVVLMLSRACPKLTHLDLGFSSVSCKASIRKLVEGCPLIESLNLEGMAAEDPYETAFYPITKLNHLKNLNLCHCLWVNDGFIYELALSECIIETLNIDGIPYVTDASMVLFLEKKGHNLKSLQLDGEGLTQATFSKLGNSVDLLELSISFSENMTCSSLEKIIALPQLKKLRIRKASKSIDFPNTSDNSAILLPLDANARSQEDSLGLTHVCGGIICGTHSLECSSGHKSLEIHNEQYSSTLSSSQCSRTMTSGIVNANALMDFSWQQLNTGNWKDVAIHWRYLYTWSCMAQISLLLQCLLRDLHTPGQKLVEVATSVQRVVRLADMGLLMGAPVAGSPLAPCASVLNPLARLSLAADERGLVPEGENMGQCRLVLGVKESNEAPLNDGQDSKVKETNLNVPLAGGSLTEGSEGNHTSQSTQSLQENSSKRWKDDANPVISGDDFPSRQGEKAETQTKLTLNSAKNRAQIFLPSESFQSNSNNDYKVTSYSSKDPPQSMKVASTSPFHELHFEGLLKSKLRALHLSPVTDFYMNNFMKQEPVKLLGLLDSWPAMKKWSPDYLRQLAGARTVPIEVGARYTDSDWSQSTKELITLDRYVTHYMTPHAAGPPGYLAQHQLLDQIPELLDDILVPDYCHLGQSEPRLNAWIGPRGTVSPLHYDPDHNILAQVVGYKYVRLYAAAETPRLYPHDDALLCNTSRVDVEGNTSHFPEFDAALFNDLILAPGDCVYIPPKCWHYVRSLSVSFSVSFWWS